MTEEPVTYVAIAQTEDNNDPVLKAKKGDSLVTFIIDHEDKCINVWYTYSEEKGDFKAIMDDLVKQLEYSWIQFISPFDDQDKKIANEVYKEMGHNKEAGFDLEGDERNIKDVLEDFQEVTEEAHGREIPMLVGFWEVEDDE